MDSAEKYPSGLHLQWLYTRLLLHSKYNLWLNNTVRIINRKHMHRGNQISEELKPWECPQPRSQLHSKMRKILLSLFASSLSFTLGLFSFLVVYAQTGNKFIVSIMVGAVSNFTWGVIFLLLIRLFTPEPYLRIAFYSFVSPTVFFGIYATYYLMIGQSA